MNWGPYMSLTEMLRTYRLTPRQLIFIADAGWARVLGDRISVTATSKAEMRELVAAASAAARLCSQVDGLSGGSSVPLEYGKGTIDTDDVRTMVYAEGLGGRLDNYFYY